MRLIKSMRTQKAVYWAPLPAGPDGTAGYDTPVEIKCRWDDAVVKFIDKKGNETVSRAVVYVDRIVSLEGVLKYAKLADITNPTDPFANKDAWEIQQFGRVPKLRAKDNTDPNKTLMIAFL